MRVRKTNAGLLRGSTGGMQVAVPSHLTGSWRIGGWFVAGAVRKFC